MRDIIDVIALAWADSPRLVILATLAIPVVILWAWVVLVVAIVSVS